MDKSRQRELKRVKSRLNIYRETIVFIASTILWLYYVTVLFVMVGSLLPYNNHFIQMVRVFLNIDKGDIFTIFSYFMIGSAIIVVYLMCTFIFNVKRKRVLPYDEM